MSLIHRVCSILSRFRPKTNEEHSRVESIPRLLVILQDRMNAAVEVPNRAKTDATLSLSPPGTGRIPLVNVPNREINSDATFLPRVPRIKSGENSSTISRLVFSTYCSL